MISRFELHYFVKPSENALFDYPHHAKITKRHKEENEHDEAGKKQVVGNSIPVGGSHMYSPENNENSCCPPYLRKELFLVVSQDFEPKKYVTENKFFSCSKSIPLLCVHRKPFFIFAVVPMDSSLFFVQITWWNKPLIKKEAGLCSVAGWSVKAYPQNGPLFAFFSFKSFMFWIKLHGED